jgi:hypothetical protein
MRPLSAYVKKRQKEGGDIGKRLVVAGIFGRLPCRYS